MNSLHENIKGKVVVIAQRYLHVVCPVQERLFLVEGGFGAYNRADGQALTGKWLCDGEGERLDGMWIERLATVDELSALPAHYLSVQLPAV